MSEADLDAVALAIARAEASTSAEIRVHLDHRCAGDPVARAVRVFERLGMHRTDGRNGVLIYAAIADRKLAVIGDAEIHVRVGEAYWRGLVDVVTGRLREGRSREGFVHAVADVGAVLSRHFPRRGDDRDELENRVSME